MRLKEAGWVENSLWLDAQLDDHEGGRGYNGSGARVRDHLGERDELGPDRNGA
ncbi:hypothetical protein GCM10010149_87650 [Nonomuraea roseoviolacea subsp. roseoviolacea]